jgi:hypothetical protein
MNAEQSPEGLRGERRKTVRSKVNLPALVLVDHEEKKTRTANVSLGGLMVQSQEALPRNQKIRVGFLAKTWPIEAEGRIVYSLRTAEGYASGLSFDSMSSTDLENLSKFLNMFGSTYPEGHGAVSFQMNRRGIQGNGEVTEIILPSSHVSAMLITTGDMKSEKTIYELDTTVTAIGRHSDNDIVLADPSVSAHHAKIRFEEDGCFIYDFASTNGTRVNENRVYRRRIKDGDIIQIGQPVFTFVTKKRS